MKNLYSINKLRFLSNINKYNKNNFNQQQIEQFIKKEERKPQNKVSLKLKEDLKSQLLKYENQKDKSHYLDESRVQDVYKKMDSSMEGFFYKRSYSTFNFNFLLQILAEQKNLQKAEETYQKMKDLNLKPNQMTFNMLIKAAAKVQNIVQAEYYYRLAKQTTGLNLQIINSLMNLYARAHDPENCEKLLLEAQNMGMQIDTPTYTTLINAFYKSGQFEKCWELYYENVVKNIDLKVDEVITGLMIEICAHTKEAEKAISFFEHISSTGFHQTCFMYNAMIKALASRSDYAQKAIELYQKMKINQIKPDQDTFVHLLMACSHKGDVQTAYNAIVDMKENNFQITKYTINEMLRVYAGAVQQDYVKPSQVELYLKDSWFLTQKAIQSGEISVNIVDSLLLVHANAIKKDQMIGMVLPLYDQLGFAKTIHTYQHLMTLYSKLNDLIQIKKIGNIIKNENLVENFYVLDYLLQTALKLQDKDSIVYCLQKFQQIKREPKPIHLKNLGNSKNLPDEILTETLKFKTKFGIVKKLYRKPAKEEEDPVDQLIQGQIKF